MTPANMTSPVIAGSAPPADDVKYLTRRQGAERLRRRYHVGSVALLAKAAMNASGPPFHLLGNKALYPVGPFDQWAETRLGVPRTEAEHRRKAAAGSELGAVR
jgi:hypothetical protein